MEKYGYGINKGSESGLGGEEILRGEVKPV